MDTDSALRLVSDYFGPIESGDEPPPVVVSAPPLPQGNVRLLLEDRVELARVYMAWHSPALFGPEDAEMDLVGELLAGSKTSRLYRALVYEQRVATEVAASQNSRELGGYFQIVATAAPGRTLAEVEAAIVRELESFMASGPTPGEMERCLSQAEAHFIYRLQTVGGFGGKSDQLNAYNVFLGDPDFFDRDLARYRDAVRGGGAGGRGPLAPPYRRISLSVVPRGRQELALHGAEPVVVS